MQPLADKKTSQEVEPEAAAQSAGYAFKRQLYPLNPDLEFLTLQGKVNTLEVEEEKPKESYTLRLILPTESKTTRTLPYIDKTQDLNFNFSEEFTVRFRAGVWGLKSRGHGVGMLLGRVEVAVH